MHGHDLLPAADAESVQGFPRFVMHLEIVFIGIVNLNGRRRIKMHNGIVGYSSDLSVVDPTCIRGRLG